MASGHQTGKRQIHSRPACAAAPELAAGRERIVALQHSEQHGLQPLMLCQPVIRGTPAAERRSGATLPTWQRNSKQCSFGWHSRSVVRMVVFS